MSTPYTHDDVYFKYDLAIIKWLGGLEVDYGSAPNDDAATVPVELVGRRSILRVFASPDRFTSTVDQVLLTTGWSADGQPAVVQHEVKDFKRMPRPYVMVQRLDEIRELRRSHIGQFTFPSADRRGPETHPYPYPVLIPYQLDFRAKQQYTLNHILEWLYAQFGRPGAAPNELYVCVTHKEPWSEKLHALKWQSAKNNSRLRTGFESEQRAFRYTVTVALNGWVTLPPTGPDDGCRYALTIQSDTVRPEDATTYSTRNLAELAEIRGRDISEVDLSLLSFDTRQRIVNRVTHVDASSNLTVYGLPAPYYNAGGSLIAVTAQLAQSEDSVAYGPVTVSMISGVEPNTSVAERREVSFSSPATKTVRFLHWARETMTSVTVTPSAGAVDVLSVTAYLRNPKLGSELLTDADLSAAGVTAWTVIGSAMIQKVAAGMQLDVSAIGDGFSQQVTAPSIVVTRIGFDSMPGGYTAQLVDVPSGTVVDSLELTSGQKDVALTGAALDSTNPQLALQLIANTATAGTAVVDVVSVKGYDGLPL